jgi:hypothetical protein
MRITFAAVAIAGLCVAPAFAQDRDRTRAMSLATVPRRPAPTART